MENTKNYENLNIYINTKKLQKNNRLVKTKFTILKGIALKFFLQFLLSTYVKVITYYI